MITRGALAEEFEGAVFGDKRLSKRLVQLGGAAEKAPGAGFPEMMGDDAALEANYRFLNNEKVSPEGILAPHFRQTLRRCEPLEEVLAVHDSSRFTFGGETWRHDLGYFPGEHQGFYGHFTLAVAPDGNRDVLGAIGLSTVFPTRPVKKKKKGRAKHKGKTDNQRLRWLDQAVEVSKQFGDSKGVVHVMDREADIYWLLSGMIENDCRFVIRCGLLNRLVADDDATYVKDALSHARFVLKRHVVLSARSAHNKGPSEKSHPDRDGRAATLEVYARSVTIRRSKRDTESAETLKLNVVYVREQDAPEGEKPVDWVLLTTDPIRTRKQVEKIVDAYRSRWVIEEFFKALKTGCAYEKRQLGSRRALLNALAVLTPCAWKLLQLRSVSRVDAQRPATRVLSKPQIAILRAHPKTKLRARATVEEAMYAIAKWGGHLRRNGPPGWLTLGRGLSSSPGRTQTNLRSARDPHQIRTRRFPPSGSSADRARGVFYAHRLARIVGAGSGYVFIMSTNRGQVMRVR